MATISFLSTPPVYIATLAITVSGPGIATPMVFNLTIDSATHIASGSITVPAGSNRHIVANAFDSLGVNTHRGDTTVTLVEGVNPPISFRMISLTGSVSIQISFGSSLLTLIPGDTTVAVGDTIHFAFAGTDENGHAIVDTVWGVDNPAVLHYVSGGAFVAKATGSAAVSVNVGFGVVTHSVTVLSGAAPSAPTGVMIFESSRNGHADLWTINPDGTGETALPTGLGMSTQGTWGPGRTKVAFVSSNDVYVMNADGSGRVQLTSSGCADYVPQISPNGQMVVWISEVGCNANSREVWVMAIDGTGKTPLTSNGVEENGPRWSADGAKIFFSSLRDGDEELYVMNADGSNQVRLTNSAGVDFGPIPSPDGTKLAFTSARDGNNEVYVMNIDGSGQLRYTSDPANDVAGGWSPDGGWIAFRSDRTGTYKVHIIPVGGGNAPAITTNLSGEYVNDWE